MSDGMSREDSLAEMKLINRVPESNTSPAINEIIANDNVANDSLIDKSIEQDSLVNNLFLIESDTSLMEAPTIDEAMMREFKRKNDSIVDAAVKYSTYKTNQQTTLWMALAFPGLGQIYNRKYWKLPIVYGGVAGITYAISWNSKTYNDYSRGYRDFMDSNPETNSYLDLIPNSYPESQIESYLEGRQSSFRRYRDLSIIVGVVFYALTVVDAFVDAALADFDVSPDLSMKVKPKLDAQPNTIKPAVGCALQLKF